MHQPPPTSTPAQERMVDELLGWGRARPGFDDGLLASLDAVLAPAVGEWLEARDRDPDARRRPLLVTKTRLTRLVCDGLQRDPVPYSHAWANVRGTLAHAAIELDVDGGRAETASGLVRRAWERLATDRPGDPASISTWLNAREADERVTLVDQTVALVASFREVWPDLSGTPLALRTEVRLVAHLGGSAVRLQGVPDIVIESPVRDTQARTLIVDLKTGMPRGQQDRDELRFYALLATLRDGRPPFRWATLYVTEGRFEEEDLSEAVLIAAARRVADAVRQAARLVGVAAESAGERLAAGDWCGRCLREDRCAVAGARYG